MGLHIGYGLNGGGFAFPLNGVPQGDLHFCLGRKVRRRVKTTCFGENIYLSGASYIFVGEKMNSS